MGGVMCPVSLMVQAYVLCGVMCLTCPVSVMGSRVRVDWFNSVLRVDGQAYVVPGLTRVLPSRK
jgi:hypothetical protein